MYERRLPVVPKKLVHTKDRPQKLNMCGYAAPRLGRVRIAFIGLGNRGPGAVERYTDTHWGYIRQEEEILRKYRSR